jgi:hypothetical protein
VIPIDSKLVPCSIPDRRYSPTGGLQPPTIAFPIIPHPPPYPERDRSGQKMCCSFHSLAHARHSPQNATQLIHSRGRFDPWFFFSLVALYLMERCYNSSHSLCSDSFFASALPSSSQSIFLQRGKAGCSMIAGVGSKRHLMSNPPYLRLHFEFLPCTQVADGDRGWEEE